MNQKERILKLEKQSRKIFSELEQYDKYGSSRPLYIKYRVKYEKLRDEIYSLIVPILERENSEFILLANENYKLLANEAFIFKNHAESWSLIGTHASALKGKLHKNGLLYCRTYKTNLPIFDLISEMRYPKEFKGKINCLGMISLKVTRRGLAFWSTIPELYTTTISSTGDVNLTIVERDIDIVSGKRIISEIVGDPFHKDQLKLSRFIQNKEKLIKLIEEYLSGLTKV